MRGADLMGIIQQNHKHLLESAFLTEGVPKKEISMIGIGVYFVKTKK